MPKLTAPLFGFHASGTLAGSLTYRDRRKLKSVGIVPTHPDAQSLAQLYQRWLYHSGVQYWHSLSPAEKATFHAGAVQARIGDFAYFMSQYLILPPDLTLWLRLDDGSGSTACDFSRHNNSATLFGPTWVAGKIAGALSFDATDDYINAGNDVSIQTPDSMTLTFWGNTTVPLLTIRRFVWKTYADGDGSQGYSGAIQDGPNRVAWNRFLDGALIQATAPFTTGDWSHFALRYDGANMEIYINGLLADTPVADARTIKMQSDLLLGGRTAIQAWNGRLDDIRLYNRALTPAHILTIATQQLFPPPG